MMKNLFLIALIGLLWISQTHAETPHRRNKPAKPIAETEVTKSQDSFTGSVLAVTDADWKQKWETPPETTPNFNKAGAVGYGTKVYILIFFSNPGQDEQQNSNVRCDLKIIDPKGATVVSKPNMNCFSGELASSPLNQYLSAPVISFAGDPGDPTGTWVVEVKLRDAVRKVDLPLRTTFELTNTDPGKLSDKPAEDPGQALPAAAQEEKPLAIAAQEDKPVAAADEALPSEVDNPAPEPAAVEAKPIAEKAPASGENWAVNLIAYKQDSLAQRKAEEFAAKGVAAKVSPVEVKGETWYRLSVDGFKNQNEATAYAAGAKKTLNLESVWINKTSHAPTSD